MRCYRMMGSRLLKSLLPPIRRLRCTKHVIALAHRATSEPPLPMHRRRHDPHPESNSGGRRCRTLSHRLYRHPLHLSYLPLYTMASPGEFPPPPFQRSWSCFLFPNSVADKDPARVAAGLKATLRNQNVSQEAKQYAQERLEDMGAIEARHHGKNKDKETFDPQHGSESHIIGMCSS